jgi:hypothetical protein
MIGKRWRPRAPRFADSKAVRWGPGETGRRTSRKGAKRDLTPRRRSDDLLEGGASSSARAPDYAKASSDSISTIPMSGHPRRDRILSFPAPSPAQHHPHALVPKHQPGPKICLLPSKSKTFAVLSSRIVQFSEDSSRVRPYADTPRPRWLWLRLRRAKSWRLCVRSLPSSVLA